MRFPDKIMEEKISVEKMLREDNIYPSIPDAGRFINRRLMGLRYKSLDTGDTTMSFTPEQIASMFPTQGRKDDDGKLPYHLIPGDALEEVVRVLQHGAKKYGDRNWEKGMFWHRPFGAIMRHAWRWWLGEDRDPDSGCLHTACIACGAFFLIAYQLRGMYDFDDRDKRLGDGTVTHKKKVDL